MASITATTASIAHSLLPLKRTTATSSSPVLGLPSIGRSNGRVRCSMEEKKPCVVGMSASLLSAAYAATMSSPAMALVDERLSTEGTGLPFGLSNNLLGWILFGVFGLIWSLYTIYTSSLEEDEESGLSL
ncbi:photosystem II reaction center W protein chloroplastic [Tripterygium wilfordii]|uniref:PSII 6.1 kDa protein n=1 Tax=Tripterygium wilfordii TaxID=458696 RepID=A0A7J7D6I2_TRIWF|nr:photosystem II reaction center W protein, chloroplastic-like [Tripterygium wilfordii]KAF5741869.1 photosystem II reaction center W protein chloroplastic [Tripterygium wilfordii]